MILIKMEKENKPQGKRHNEGRTQWRYLHPKALEGLAKVFMNSANNGKYEPFNYTAGLSQTEIMESLKRHWDDYLSGEDCDHDSGLPLTWHIMANAYLLEFNRLFHTELDDRFFKTFQKNEYKQSVNGVISALEDSLVGEERNNEVSIDCKLKEEPKDTYLDIQCDKHSIENEFTRGVTVVLQSPKMSNISKMIAIRKCTDKRDEAFAELGKRKNEFNNGHKELTKDDIADIKTTQITDKINTDSKRCLFNQIKGELKQYFERLRCSDDGKGPINLVNTTADMYFESFSFVEMQTSLDNDITKLKKENKNTCLFEEKKKGSRTYLKNRLKNILLDFHDRNNLMGNFEQYQSCVVEHIICFINEFVGEIRDITVANNKTRITKKDEQAIIAIGDCINELTKTDDNEKSYQTNKDYALSPEDFRVLKDEFYRMHAPQSLLIGDIRVNVVKDEENTKNACEKCFLKNRCQDMNDIANSHWLDIESVCAKTETHFEQ